MKTVTFTEFRSHASGLLSEVERGESLVIIRHGRPIAKILPYTKPTEEPSWKRKGPRLSVKGQGIADLIIKERRSEDVL